MSYRSFFRNKHVGDRTELAEVLFQVLSGNARSNVADVNAAAVALRPGSEADDFVHARRLRLRNFHLQRSVAHHVRLGQATFL